MTFVRVHVPHIVRPNNSIGLVLVQKKSMRTWLSKSSGSDKIVDFIGPRMYYENLDSEPKKKANWNRETKNAVKCNFMS